MVRITDVKLDLEAITLTQPYTITYRTIAVSHILRVEVHTDAGLVGYGAANPSPHVVGEDSHQAFDTLQAHADDWLIGADIRERPQICRDLAERLPQQPGALAALDIALHDLYAKLLNLPLARCLGQVHDRLPTSITIGIKGVEETLAEAARYVDEGFRHLKVKLGHHPEEDLERLHKLREVHGQQIWIRVDANQGYTKENLQALLAVRERLQLELIEQPLPVALQGDLLAFPEADRRALAADEGLLDAHSALALCQPPLPYGIFNIKLMKCGGITAALHMAHLAEIAGISLMWGCNDESLVSISAGLHAAFACPNTRYLDLDGSLDLPETSMRGGFVLQEGHLHITDAPGLGVEPA